MRTIADTALGSIAGLVVLAAIFTSIWIARGYSAAAATDPASTSVRADAPLQALQSPRTQRAPLVYTPMAPAQQRALQEK
jgi:hypothetical protein